MIRAVSAREANGLQFDGLEAVVVCDPDPEFAARVAKSLPCRTAVYAGSMEDPAAAELVRELTGGLRP